MSYQKPLAIAAFSTALIIGATSSFAFGSHGNHKMGGPGKNIFKKLDLNKDGVITRQEAQEARAQRFGKIDADGDGTVTVAEIDKAIEKKLRRMQVRLRYKMLSRLDSDGDGQVTKEEFDAKPMRFFDRADRNGDGQVTKQEARQMKQRGRKYMRGMKRRMNGQMNQGMKHHRQGGHK